MNTSALGSALLPVLFLILILWRQLRERPVKEENPYVLMIVFAAIGITETWNYVGTKHINALAFMILGMSLIIGAAFGVLRGRMTHIWRDNGVLVQKGNWIVLAIWFVSLGLHLSIDLLINKVDASANQLGSVSTLIYMAVTLSAQRFMVLQRAEAALDKVEFQAQQKSGKK